MSGAVEHLIELFKSRLRECEEALEFAEVNSWFRLQEMTQSGGWKDITEQHKQGLREQCAEYQHALEDLKADRP